MTKAQLALPGLACAALFSLSACSGSAAPAAPAGATNSPAAPASSAPAAPATSTSQGSPAAPAASESTSTTAPAGGAGAPQGEPQDASAFMQKMAAGMATLKTYQATITSSTEFMGKPIESKSIMKVDQSTPGKEKTSTTVETDRGSSVMVTDGGTMYISEDGGKTFKKSSLSSSSASPAAGQTPGTGAVVDPKEIAKAGEKMFKDARNFKKGATETVGGTPCTHYSFEPSMGDSSTPSASGMQMKLINDYCVDSQWRMIKSVSQSEVKASGTTSKSTNTMTYSNFDKPVDIKVPSGSQVKG